jgi:hypothetical protein
MEFFHLKKKKTKTTTNKQQQHQLTDHHQNDTQLSLFSIQETVALDSLQAQDQLLYL